MPGVPGSGGPIPKRSDQLRRRNKRPEPTKAPAGSRRLQADEPPRSGKGSGTDVWREYAEGLGLTVPAGASRGAIFALVDESRTGAPEAADGWHPLARAWYESLAESGQAVFYEPSDWLTAQLLAEAISRELSPQSVVVGRGREAKLVKVTGPPSGAAMSAWFSAMSSLLVTEGDRRRLRVELQREDAEDDGEEQPATVTDIRSWKEGLCQ